MGNASYTQESFLGGEWSVRAQGRIGAKDYRTAMSLCYNGFPVETGAWVRRPGTRYAGHTKGGLAGRVFPFAFDQAAPYTVELTNSAMRFRNGSNLTTTNDPQTIVSISTATPAKVKTGVHGWTTGSEVFFDLLGLSGAILQNRQFLITVTSTTEFTIADPVTGAAIDGSTIGALIAGARVQRILSFATSYTGTLWKDVRAVQAQTISVLLHKQIQPASLTVTGAPAVGTDASFTFAPQDFQDGPYLDVMNSTFFTPDGSGAGGAVIMQISGAYLTYLPNGFQATDVGRHVRWKVIPRPGYDSTHAYTTGDTVEWQGVSFIARKATTGNQPPVTPVTSNSYWTADGAVQWMWGKIASVTNSTTVIIAILGGLGDGIPVNGIIPQTIFEVRLGVYSNSTGWPTCGTYHEGRLWLAGYKGNRLDGSKPNDIFNFAPTAYDGTVADSNAIAAVFNAPQVNTIFWLEPDQLGIVVGTQAGEWIVQASNQNNVLTPTSIQVHQATRNGCANMEPRKAGGTLVVVQRYKRNMMEYFADVYSGKFNAQNLSVASGHLTGRGVEELGYQQELAPLIWARCADGSLIGCSYKREANSTSSPPDFAGWHQHALGSGRTVESVCVGPSVGGDLDALSMVTNDSGNVRHVEIMTDLMPENPDITDGWFLDDAVSPSSYQIVSNTDFLMNGLWHHNGKTVSVFAGGLDLGEHLVTNGSLIVKFVDSNIRFTPAFVASFTPIITIIVGFKYASRGQIVRPATPQETGARQGPGFGKIRRQHQYALMLEGTQGIRVGTDFSKLNRCNFKSPGGRSYEDTELFTGVFWDSLQDGYSYDSMFCWEVTGPYPATVALFSGFIATQDT